MGTISSNENKPQENDFESDIDEEAENHFYDKQTQALSEFQTEIPFQAAQSEVRRIELADKMWQAVFDKSNDQYEYNEKCAVDQQQLLSSENVGSSKKTNLSQVAKASNENTSVDISDDTVSSEDVEEKQDKIKEVVNEIINEAVDEFDESPSKKFKFSTEFVCNKFERDLNAQTEDFEKNKIEEAAMEAKPTTMFMTRDFNKSEIKTFLEQQLNNNSNNLLQNTQVSTENVFIIPDDSEDKNTNELLGDKKAETEEKSIEKEIKAGFNSSNEYLNLSFESMMQQLTIDKTAFKSSKDNTIVNTDKVLENDSLTAENIFEKSYVNNKTEDVELNIKELIPIDTEEPVKDIKKSLIENPNLILDLNCYDPKNSKILNAVIGSEKNIQNLKENEILEVAGELECITLMSTLKNSKKRVFSEGKESSAQQPSVGVDVCNLQSLLTPIENVIEEIKSNRPSTDTDQNKTEQTDVLENEVIAKRPRISKDIDRNETKETEVLEDVLKSAKQSQIYDNATILNVLNHCPTENKEKTATENSLKTFDKASEDLSESIQKKVDSEKNTKEKTETKELLEPQDHICEALTKKAKTESCADILPNESILLYPPPKYDEEPKKLSLDFLKRFRKTYNKMTRNDLEEFVLQKVVETIVFENEFADLRITIEKQENLIAQYHSNLSQLVKQFRDLKMLHESVVKDLKERNSKYLIPKRVTRSIGLQVKLSNSVPNIQTANVSEATSITKSVNAEKIEDFQQNTVAKVSITPEPTSIATTENVQPKVNKKIFKNMNFTENPQYMVSIQNSSSLTTMSLPNTIEVDSPFGGNTAQKDFENVEKRKPSKTTMPIIVELDSPLVECSAENGSKLAEKSQKSDTPKLDSNIQQTSADKNFESTKKSKLLKSPMPILLQEPIQKNTFKTGSQSINVLKRPKSSAPIFVELESVIQKNYAVKDSQSTTTPIIVDLDSPFREHFVEKNSETVELLQRKTTEEIIHIENEIGQSANHNSIIDLTDENDVTSELSIQPRNLSLTNNIQLNEPKSLIPNIFNRDCPVRRTRSSGSNFTRFGTNEKSTAHKCKHPAPLPPTPPTFSWKPYCPSYWKMTPPKPTLLIHKVYGGIEIIWNILEPLNQFAKINSYEIFVYHVTNAPPLSDLWFSLGFIKPVSLPMAVTVTQFPKDQRYFFAVRAIDVHQRCGAFSVAETWH